MSNYKKLIKDHNSEVIKEITKFIDEQPLFIKGFKLEILDFHGVITKEFKPKEYEDKQIDFFLKVENVIEMDKVLQEEEKVWKKQKVDTSPNELENQIINETTLICRGENWIKFFLVDETKICNGCQRCVEVFWTNRNMIHCSECMGKWPKLEKLTRKTDTYILDESKVLISGEPWKKLPCFQTKCFGCKSSPTECWMNYSNTYCTLCMSKTKGLEKLIPIEPPKEKPVIPEDVERKIMKDWTYINSVVTKKCDFCKGGAYKFYERKSAFNNGIMCLQCYENFKHKGEEPSVPF